MDLSAGRTLAPPAAPAGDPTPTPRNAADAAQQFEALLLTQMLRAARSEDASLDSESSDSSKDTMWDMAAQQFAQVLAANGGLGIARMIAAGLAPQPPAPPPPVPQPPAVGPQPAPILPAR